MADEDLLPPAASWRHSGAPTLPPPFTMGRRERPRTSGVLREPAPAEPDETTQRLDRAWASADEHRPLRIALLAPPWRPVTPSSDGPVEAGLALLADALVTAGHDVTLFAPPGSRSLARVVSVLDRAHELEVGASMVEADHTARAFAAIERAQLDGTPFDLVHDHSGWTALAMADRLPAPVVHTVHGPFDEDAREWYRAHGAKAAIVCLSRAHAAARPAGMRVDAIVSNPVASASSAKDDFLLWVGRIAPGTGAAQAIRVARAAGRPLVLAGGVEPEAGAYFSERIAPHIEGARIMHVGDLGGGRKRDLLMRAGALLMPTTWTEPFGAIMVEAMAMGTPVIAAPRGSAPEVIEDGRTGVLVGDGAELAAAVDRAAAVDSRQCQARAAERFGPSAVAERYAAVYRAIARPLPGDGAPALAERRLRPARCTSAAATAWRRPRPCARH